MKKIILAVCLLKTTFCIALPLTNIADPSLYECSTFRNPLDYGLTLRTGYWGDFVFNRDAAQQIDGGEYQRAPGLSIHTNAGFFALNYCNLIEAFGTAGQSDFEYMLAQPNQIVNFFPAISWSAGLRSSYRCGHWIFGLEGQYMQAKHTSAYTTNLITGVVSYFNHNVSGTYREAQGGFGLAYHLESFESFDFVPYLGMRFGYFSDSFSLQSLPYKTRADKSVGYAAGATFLLGHAIGMTVEGRYGDEKALFVNGQFRF